MDDYNALSDDSFDDFIVGGDCQEKQNSKDIENTNLKILFRIQSVYHVMNKYV